MHDMTDDLRVVTPTLLLVDDDESVRRGLRRLLSSAGYVVETFANATELLARDPLSVPGCLILDVHLPDLSGLGTSEKTVKVHRARVMTKLEASSVPDLVRVADRLGLRYRDMAPTSEADSDASNPHLSP